MLGFRSPFDRSCLIKWSGSELEPKRMTEGARVRGIDKRNHKTAIAATAIVSAINNIVIFVLPFGAVSSKV